MADQMSWRCPAITRQSLSNRAPDFGSLTSVLGQYHACNRHRSARHKNSALRLRRGAAHTLPVINYSRVVRSRLLKQFADMRRGLKGDRSRHPQANFCTPTPLVLFKRDIWLRDTVSNFGRGDDSNDKRRTLEARALAWGIRILNRVEILGKYSSMKIRFMGRPLVIEKYCPSSHPRNTHNTSCCVKQGQFLYFSSKFIM